MAYIHRTGDKRKSVEEFDYDDGHDELDMSPGSPKNGHPMESEKRLRRQIANSNERRRMQSINAGFESLKTLIPHHREEKLSKAAILQQTSEYISNLESEKSRLLSQNSILRHHLKELNQNPDTLVGSLADQITPPPPPAPPVAKRKKCDTESSDEGISLGFDEVQLDELRKEVVELRHQLERERKLRQALESRTALPPPPTTTTTATPVPIKSELLSTHQPTSPPPPPPPSHVAQQPPQQQQQQHKQLPPVVPEPVPQTKFEVVAPPSGSTVLPPTAPPPRHIPVFNSSMSKRNLDTIVEAIRHLEGEHVLADLRRPLQPSPVASRAEDSSSSPLSSSSPAQSSDDAADSPLPVGWPLRLLPQGQQEP